jgi:hypothetical protein
MSVSENLDLHGVRWSLVCFTGCARAGMYGAQDAPQDELDPRDREKQQARFQLGHDLSDKHRERDVTLLEQEGHRCEVEAEVAWPRENPIGTGHIDLRVTAPDGLVGVNEYTTNKGGTLGENKALQCAGYALNTSATAATVTAIDIETGQAHHYPLDVEGLAPRVRELQQSVVDAIHTGHADRVCRHPGEARKRGCPFSTHCFRDWEPPEVDQIIGLDEQLRTLADLEDQYAEAKAAYDEADDARKALRAEIRPLLPTGQDVIGAISSDGSAVKIKVSVSYRTTFSLSEARKCGWTVSDDLKAFEKTSESERWTVRRIPGAAT